MKQGSIQPTYCEPNINNLVDDDGSGNSPDYMQQSHSLAANRESHRAETAVQTLCDAADGDRSRSHRHRQQVRAAQVSDSLLLAS